MGRKACTAIVKSIVERGAARAKSGSWRSTVRTAAAPERRGVERCYRRSVQFGTVEVVTPWRIVSCICGQLCGLHCAQLYSDLCQLRLLCFSEIVMVAARKKCSY